MADRTLTRPGFSASRRERIAVVGSPPARAFLATIAAGAALTIDFEDPGGFENGRHNVYLPFNRLTITNNSGVRITVVAGGITYGVLARQERTYTDIWYRSFRVTNEDGAAATGANNVEFIADHAPVDADKAARLNVGRSLFGG